MNKLWLFGFVLLLLISSVNAFDTTDFVLYHSYDDADLTGSNPNDLTGNGYDGTNFGSTTGQTGKLKQSFYYDGTNDYVTVTSDSGLAPASISISLWFKPTNTITPGSIAEREVLFKENQNVFIEIDRNDDGKLEFLLYDNVAGFHRIASTTTSWSSGTWYHIVCTYDGSNMKIYVDGSLETNTGGFSFTNGRTTSNLYIGSESGTSRYFIGNIDEVAVLDKSIDNTEVSELYNGGNGFNPFFVETEFDITLKNAYNGTSINTFKVNVTNLTGIYTYLTTNGTIVANISNTADLTFYDIEGIHLDRTYFNVDTSINFEGEVGESVLIVQANETNTNVNIGNFTATIGNVTNWANSTNEATFYLNVDTYSYTGESDKYIVRSTGDITTTNAIQYETIYFNNLINVTAIDINTTVSISNFSILVNDTDSYSTTNGTVNNVFCSYPDCDINFNATSLGYVLLNVSQHFSKNNLQANLSNAEARFKFVEADTLSPILNASVTVNTVDGRTINTRTDQSGYLNFSLIYLDNIKNGNYTITFNGLQGFISPVSFERHLNDSILPYEEQIGIGKTGITINVYDRETRSLLSGRDVNIFMLSVFNTTTTTGSYVLTNVSMILGDYVITTESDGYFTEQRKVSITGQENVSIDFYMLNSTGTNTGLVFVTSEFNNRLQQGASVEMYEYFTEGKAFVKVSECDSNINGECTFAIELNQKIYYFTSQKTIDGVTYSSQTNEEIIRTDEETRKLILSFSDLFSLSVGKYLTVDFSETFENNISTIFMDFRTTDNFNTQVCVEYFKEQYNLTSTYKQCVTASGGYVATPVLLDRDFRYVAQIYQVSGTDKYIIKTYNYPAINSFEDVFTKQNYFQPIYVWFWGALLVLSLLFKSIEMFSIGGIILSWVQLGSMPTLAVGSISAIKTVMLLTLLKHSRKTEDLN